MRAILIDPSERKILEADLPFFTSEIREQLGGSFKRVATLPNGDTINVAASLSAEVFSLGGSPKFSGYGIILGQRRAFGEFKPARSNLNAIIDLTVFGIGQDATRVFRPGHENAERRSFHHNGKCAG
jgi:hypothetical protein